MEVNLFGKSQFGKSSNVTSQQRLNCYVEFGKDDRNQVAIYGTPGLDLFTSFGDTPIRGIWKKGDFLYVVHRGTFYEVNNAGTKTVRGTIATTSGKVYMADNGTQLMLTDGTLTGGYIYNFNTLAFVQITDPDYPGAATLAWQDSYFIINPPNSQQFYISGINNGLTWDALDFASAETNPDNIVRVDSDNATLYLWGDITTEFWTNSGAQDFPFTQISGGATEWGLAAVNSVCKYDNSLAFLAKNRMGQVIIARMTGYLPQRISTPELEYIINNYGAVSDAVAFSYMLGGHPMYQINFPTGNQSWLYDGLSQVWSQVQSYGMGRHRAELGIEYINKIIVTDNSNGNLYRLNPLSYTDNGDPIVMELISRHISKDDARITIDKLQLDMETGVGLATGQGSNPQIMLSISKDGGHEYLTTIWTSFGAIGNYLTRAIWWSLGQSRDWTFKFRITDPVKRVIFGSSINMRVGK
jgi:Phage stabilisation protein